MLTFGLLEDEPNSKVSQVKLSALALSLLRDTADTPQRRANLREAAMNAPVYAEIVHQWPAELPSDAVIAQFLTAEKGFNPNTIAGVIRDFRATYDLAQLGNRAADPQEQSEEEEEENPPVATSTTPTPSVAHTASVTAPQEAVEAEAKEGAVDTPPGGQSKSSKPNTTPAAKDEEEKYIVPLLGGRRLVVRYPKVLAESEVQMVESALAMIRASLGAG